jgi:8-oxo-dGTP diphosphatase
MPLSESMTKPKDRVFGAIIQDGHILMVHHRHDGRDYWTLPGGGVELGEAPDEAIIREVKEETYLDVTVDRLLFDQNAELAGGVRRRESCFLLKIGGGELGVGSDPELPPDAQMITGVSWFSLQDKIGDIQVSKVLESLRHDEVSR